MPPEKMSKSAAFPSPPPRSKPVSSKQGKTVSKTVSWVELLAGLILLLAVAAVYSNSLKTALVFDDRGAILDNPTIRSLGDLRQVLSPPCHGETVTGRPLLNLTFAVNYAISGTEVWSYHAVNVFIHMLGALLFFVILRRTLMLPSMEPFHSLALPIAFSAALFWAVHPLQVESITYIVQRAESLVGLFYLLTLFCAIQGALASDSIEAVGPAVRSSQILKSRAWYGAAVLACLLGMASKEVMVSAPLMVLLYDRTFLSGNFREAWRRRRGLYLGLAGTWLLLGWLVISAKNRGGSAGFNTAIDSWSYLCTQFGAIVDYLRLCAWPHPLIFDHGTATAHGVAAILPYAVVVVALGIATVVALWRWPKVGFLGAWFFAILAPTSSIVPVATQTVAEHRMYLPLAAVVVLAVMAGLFVGQSAVRQRRISEPMAIRLGWGLVAFVGIALAVVAYQRNFDYRTELSIWQDTVKKLPENGRAHNNCGLAFANCDQNDRAIEEYVKSLKCDPEDVQAHSNYGVTLVAVGKVEEGLSHYQAALKIKPDYANAHYNLGVALMGIGRIQEAIEHYEQALRLQQDHFGSQFTLGDVHYNLGNAWMLAGNLNEAAKHFREAIAIEPNREEPYSNLASLLATSPDGTFARNGAEAVQLAQQAVMLSKGQNPQILDVLATALAEAGRFPEAVQTAQKAALLAQQQNNVPLVQLIQAQISLFTAGKPFRNNYSASGSPP